MGSLFRTYAIVNMALFPVAAVALGLYYAKREGKQRGVGSVPAGRTVGIDKLNYHMFRRGFATEANRHGIRDKLIHGQLRPMRQLRRLACRST